MAYMNTDIDIDFENISGVDSRDMEIILKYFDYHINVDQIAKLSLDNDMQLISIEEKKDVDKMHELIKKLTGIAQIYNEMTVGSMVNHYTSMTTLLDNYNLED